MDGFQNINFCEVLEFWKYIFFHMIFPKGDAKSENQKKKKKKAK